MSMKSNTIKSAIDAFIKALGKPTTLTPPVRYKSAYWDLEGRSVSVYQSDDGKIFAVLIDYQGKCAGHALRIVRTDANPEITTLRIALLHYGTCTLDLAVEAATHCLLEGLP